MNIFYSLRTWIRLSFIVFGVLLLIAPSCGVAGGPEVACKVEATYPAIIRSMQATIKNPAARSGASGCVTAPKLATANTVTIKVHTGLGVEGRPFTAYMSKGGTYNGAPCFVGLRFKSNNYANMRMACNFFSAGTQIGFVVYTGTPVATWVVNVF